MELKGFKLLTRKNGLPPEIREKEWHICLMFPNSRVTEDTLQGFLGASVKLIQWKAINTVGIFSSQVADSYNFTI